MSYLLWWVGTEPHYVVGGVLEYNQETKLLTIQPTYGDEPVSFVFNPKTGYNRADYKLVEATDAQLTELRARHPTRNQDGAAARRNRRLGLTAREAKQGTPSDDEEGACEAA